MYHLDGENVTNTVCSFGESFHMLKEGSSHDYMRIVQGFAYFNALVCTIPWSGSLFAWFPKNQDAQGLFDFTGDRTRKRLSFSQSKKDIFAHFLVPDRVTKKKLNNIELELEAFEVIIGGMDLMFTLFLFH